MKQLRKLNRKQKVFLSENNLEPGNYLVERVVGQEHILFNKKTNKLERYIITG